MSRGNTRNDLFQRQGRWIGDLSSNGRVEVIQHDHIRIESKSTGTPFNVLFDIAEQNGETSKVLTNFYFETKIEESNGNVAVGVATFDHFKKGGWKSRGMFYNGNVTNGSAGLIIGFGDYPKQGDTIGVLVSRKETMVGDDATDGFKVANYINGRCLGTAFHLRDEVSKESLFLPCFHVRGSVTLQYNAPEILPKISEREDNKYANKYLGDWKLEKAFEGPELGEFPIPDGLDVILSLGEGRVDKSYDLSVKVGNTLNTTVKIVGEMEAFDKIEVNPNITSTRMLPPPHIDKVERMISKSLPTFHKMIVSPNDGGTLILTAVAAELIFKRFFKKFPILSKYD